MSKPAKKKITGASLRNAFEEIIWPRRGLVGLGLVLILVNRLAGLVLPTISKYLVDEATQAEGATQLVLGGVAFDIRMMLVALTIAIAIQAATSYALTMLLSVEAQHLIANLRTQVQQHVLQLPVRVFDNTKSGELVSRIMDDVEGVRNLVGTGLVQLVGGTITAIVAFTFLVNINPVMTGLALVPLAAFGFVSTRAFQTLRPAFRERGKIRAEVTGRLTEALGGIRIIKGFHALEKESRSSTRACMRIFDNVKTTLTTSSLVSSLGTFFMGSASVMVLGYGSMLITRGELTAGGLVSFILFLGFMIAPVIQMANIGTQMTEAFAGLDRTSELLSWKQEDDDPLRTTEMPDIVGHLSFEDVHFQYEDDKPVLQGVPSRRPRARSWRSSAARGPGSRRWPAWPRRFLTPDEGRVVVDGVDLRTVKLASYRSQLGLVFQDDFLFDGTIRENLRFARPEATDPEIEDAARKAYVHEFADRFPDGLDTVIGERGVKLSGGQRQRVTIARALLADPRLLLLDEATSSLDTESEALIQKSLNDLLSGRTTIVIAHRLSTIQRADLILVIEAGRIVERGRHDELMAMEGRYHQLYTVQARI